MKTLKVEEVYLREYETFEAGDHRQGQRLFTPPVHFGARSGNVAIVHL